MKKTPTKLESMLALLKSRHARYKFRELKDLLAVKSNKDMEALIRDFRKLHPNLVYGKFDGTYFLSDVPTWYSNQTDLSAILPSGGRIGFMSDTHLASVAERLDILEEAFDIFAARGITHVFHTGDMTDGFHQYRSHHQYVKVYGDAPQAIYAIKHWPKREGITTYVIGGNHDHDHNKSGHERLSMVVNGLDYEGKHYEGRKDIVYLGPYSHTILMPQEVTMHLLHPMGGNTYALSYKQQKRSEAMDRNLRPDIQVSGHFHQFNFTWMNHSFFMAMPGVQDETEYTKRLGLNRQLGFVVAKYKIVNARLEYFSPEVYMY